MTRFNDTKVDYKSGTVEIGAGLTWGQVYAALEPTGVNVVGGRIPDVGVAGLTLGGGEYLSQLPVGELDLKCFQAIPSSQVSMALGLITSSDMSSFFRMELSSM